MLKVRKPNRRKPSNDPRDYTILDNVNLFRVYKHNYGEGIIPKWDGSFNPFTVTIKHNLGYNPIFLVYVWDTRDNKWRRAPFKVSDSSGNKLNADFQYTDPNTITLRMFYDDGQPSADTSVKYRYFIFANPLNEVWS